MKRLFALSMIASLLSLAFPVFAHQEKQIDSRAFTYQYLTTKEGFLDGLANEFNFISFTRLRDGDFIFGSTNGAVRFNPGDYTFRVKSMSKNGKQQLDAKAIRTHIAQPYWNTCVAWLIYLLVWQKGKDTSRLSARVPTNCTTLSPSCSIFRRQTKSSIIYCRMR